MREINDHKVNLANDTITIEAMDEPGAGNANHRYVISGFDSSTNPSSTKDDEEHQSSTILTVLFQNGAIGEAGVNGVTHEVLLAIVADRLKSFQNGPYACRENALALTKIEEAQHWLQSRTLARMRRGVEGTMKI